MVKKIREMWWNEDFHAFEVAINGLIDIVEDQQKRIESLESAPVSKVFEVQTGPVMEPGKAEEPVAKKPGRPRKS